MLVYIGRALTKNWRSFRAESFDVHLTWSYLVASAAVVLLTYALLVDVWRRIVRAWGAELGFVNAVRIWAVTNLGRYLPAGNLIQIAAMGDMARRVAVPPAAAIGSSLLSNLVAIPLGFAVGIAAGFRAMNDVSNGHRTLGIAVTFIVLAGVLALPVILPQLTAIAERITGRSLQLGTLPMRAVYVAVIGNLVAWLLYGWAFQLLVHGVLGRSEGTLSDYVAAYALSYVMGYLVFLLPSGAGVREAAQITVLTTLKLATSKEALLISVVSRLMMTILEVLPGLLFMATGTRFRPPRDGTLTKL